ncbi:MAG: hypothetical protein M5U19_17280 [Microthrixaceae bacterium]|nr:hypothetical protein [Microthrixaceae bacterium]
MARPICTSPMPTMSPVSSATSMNSSGDTSPSTGCFQRARPSAETIRPVIRSTFGWKWVSTVVPLPSKA